MRLPLLPRLHPLLLHCPGLCPLPPPELLTEFAASSPLQLAVAATQMTADFALQLGAPGQRHACMGRYPAEPMQRVLALDPINLLQHLADLCGVLTGPVVETYSPEAAGKAQSAWRQLLIGTGPGASARPNINAADGTRRASCPLLLVHAAMWHKQLVKAMQQLMGLILQESGGGTAAHDDSWLSEAAEMQLFAGIVHLPLLLVTSLRDWVAVCKQNKISSDSWLHDQLLLIGGLEGPPALGLPLTQAALTEGFAYLCVANATVSSSMLTMGAQFHPQLAIHMAPILMRLMTVTQGYTTSSTAPEVAQGAGCEATAPDGASQAASSSQPQCASPLTSPSVDKNMCMNEDALPAGTDGDGVGEDEEEDAETQKPRDSAGRLKFIQHVVSQPFIQRWVEWCHVECRLAMAELRELCGGHADAVAAAVAAAPATATDRSSVPPATPAAHVLISRRTTW